MTAAQVIAGERQWAVERADVLDFLRGLPAGSVDLVFGSPPYERARSYSIGFNLKGQAWVDWMVQVYRESVRVCKGVTAFVVGHGQRLYKWSAAPYLLVADLHRTGFHVRPPLYFHRVGIPGSGQKDWFRADVEVIVCVTSQPGRLPWSDNTACGHPPKWAPGGEMSNRVSDGTRVNQWGGHGEKSTRARLTNGEREPIRPRKSHTFTRLGADMAHGIPGSTKGSCIGRRVPRGHALNGEYLPPVLANPGTLISCNVGGGAMGSKYAHINEAPFPETLVERFVLSFCLPGGVTLDPFAGSGTTLAKAVKHARRAIGCDVRQSQVDLTTRRMAGVTPEMFVCAPAQRCSAVVF